VLHKDSCRAGETSAHRHQRNERQMHLKTLIGCAILTPILFANPLLSREAAAKTISDTPARLLAFNLPAVEVGERTTASPAVVLAQAGDPQVNDLLEQIRRLNGKVEELNFQILQMQDQMRKQQQDNEYRLDQLEKKRTDAGAGAGTNVAGAGAGTNVARDAAEDSTDGQNVQSIIKAPDDAPGKVAEGN